MVVKAFVQSSLAAGDVIALVSVDEKGAFDAAWWPAILKEMGDCRSPNNLYKLTNKLLCKMYSDSGSKQHNNGERVK